jgi:hypothetical protein
MAHKLRAAIIFLLISTKVIAGGGTSGGGGTEIGGDGDGSCRADLDVEFSQN